jgi:8-oxo-dGTP pyrophosphatase MutT (NUDIX family)
MLNTDLSGSLLRHPLPGALAHDTMQPWPPLRTDAGAYREAAVLVLLSPLGRGPALQPERLVVTLIRRARSTHHSNELAFPGGMRDGDEPLMDTAVREAREEIGIASRRLEILGALSKVHTATSRAVILPVVALARRSQELRANEEVEAMIHVRLASLLDPASRDVEIVRHPELGPRRIPFFAIGDAKLWGASARIMAELLAVVCGSDRILKGLRGVARATPDAAKLSPATASGL